MADEKGMLYGIIESAKQLEQQLAEEGSGQEEEVAYDTDAFYPLDAVREILREGLGTIEGACPPLSKEAYYYCENMDGAYAFCEVQKEHVEELLAQLEGLGFWTPDPAQYGEVWFCRYAQQEYAKSPLYFIGMRLCPEAQGKLVRKFCQWYGDTEQETGQYAAEFYLVVSGILSGMLVLNPKYLLLGDVLQELMELLPEEARSCYTKSREHVGKGQRLFPCLK